MGVQFSGLWLRRTFYCKNNDQYAIYYMYNACYINIVFLIGTHDIQNILVTSPTPGELRVTGNFIDRSTAIGLLVIVYSLTNDSDVHYLSGRVHSQMIEANMSGLTDSQYNVSIFVIEENGLPLSRVAALPILIKNNSTGNKLNMYVWHSRLHCNIVYIGVYCIIYIQ